jgi:hypothetical protein
VPYPSPCIAATPAPGVPTDDLFVPTNDLLVETNDLLVETNDPFVPTNDPFVPTNDPFVPTNDLFVPTNDPFVPTNDPFVPTNDPFRGTERSAAGLSGGIAAPPAHPLDAGRENRYTAKKGCFFKVTILKKFRGFPKASVFGNVTLDLEEKADF